jgi:hypothetical protein
MPETVLVIHSKKLPPLEHSAKIESVKDLLKFFKSASRFISQVSRMFPELAKDNGVSITVKKT